MKEDGKNNMGSREATTAENEQHEAAGYHVARLKGGSKLHLRQLGKDAICGSKPSSKGSFRMVDRSGWETYKQGCGKRATCLKCLDGFVVPAAASNWPFPEAAAKPAEEQGS